MSATSSVPSNTVNVQLVLSQNAQFCAWEWAETPEGKWFWGIEARNLRANRWDAPAWHLYTQDAKWLPAVADVRPLDVIIHVQ